MKTKFAFLMVTLVIAASLYGSSNAYSRSQTGSWTLTISFTNVPFQTKTIWTEIKGSFGYDQKSGPNPNATITMPGSDFPSGYQGPKSMLPAVIRE